METESMTVLQPEDEVNSATVCAEDEGMSVCVCENDEEVTLFEQDDDIELDYDIPFPEEETDAESSKDLFNRKCREVREAVQSTMTRLANDWKECDGNPHIKYTRTTQIDIYRKPDDEEPIDSFRTVETQSLSARSLALLGIGSLVLSCTAKSIVKNVFKKR